MSDPVLEPVRFIDERTASAPLLKKALRYVFPDHWSLLLGEVALYCFILLIATGIYLALFYSPSTAHTVYHGPYLPLVGQDMSAAYKSVLDISFTVKAGLLIRQTHHWAADVFLLAVVLHLMRVFFTGAFRRPRELTWIIGLIMLFTALLEGYLGYSLVDDLLSGMGLAIGYGVALSIPLVGGPLALLIWGAPVNLDISAVLFAKVLGFIFGAESGGLEERVIIRFGNHAEGQRLFGACSRDRQRAQENSKGQGEEP